MGDDIVKMGSLMALNSWSECGLGHYIGQQGRSSYQKGVTCRDLSAWLVGHRVSRTSLRGSLWKVYLIFPSQKAQVW